MRAYSEKIQKYHLQIGKIYKLEPFVEWNFLVIPDLIEYKESQNIENINFYTITKKDEFMILGFKEYKLAYYEHNVLYAKVIVLGCETIGWIDSHYISDKEILKESIQNLI